MSILNIILLTISENLGFYINFTFLFMKLFIKIYAILRYLYYDNVIKILNIKDV